MLVSHIYSTAIIAIDKIVTSPLGLKTSQDMGLIKIMNCDEDSSVTQRVLKNAMKFMKMP